MPIVLLKEGATETKGREAQRNNIQASKIIAEIVKTSLGPRGMDKMLVDSLGDVTITNDGATILKEIDVQHPAAKMLVEISKTTDNEVGDGTTSVVIFAGALLENAESLLNQDVHPKKRKERRNHPSFGRCGGKIQRHFKSALASHFMSHPP